MTFFKVTVTWRIKAPNLVLIYFKTYLLILEGEPLQKNIVQKDQLTVEYHTTQRLSR